MTEEDFYRLCEKDIWNEIASAKNSELSHSPVVFTNQLFQQGLKTLVHEITAYFSRFATEEAVQKSIKDEIAFELIFGDNEALDPDKEVKNSSLWISITTCKGPTKYFYLKKFNCNSSPWRFAAMLLREYPKGGIVEVELGSAESISKFIERMGLDGDMRDIFFGRSEGNRVPFNGKCVTLKKCANGKFWGLASVRGQIIKHGFKMKWHNIGNGKVQLRLAVAIVNHKIFLCQWYVKRNDKTDQRELNKFKIKTQKIIENDYEVRGIL